MYDVRNYLFVSRVVFVLTSQNSIVRNTHKWFQEDGQREAEDKEGIPTGHEWSLRGWNRTMEMGTLQISWPDDERRA